MPQAFNFTPFGTLGTSTGAVTLSTGPVLLHTINILSSGTGTVTFYNATASSTGSVVGVLTVGVPNSYLLDVTCPSLIRGHTTSTAEMLVSWA